MATIEIDEVEFQQNKHLRDTISKMMANPKAKRKLLEAEKILSPDKKIPEIDEPDPIEAKLEAQQKAIDDFRKEQTEKESKREQEDKIRALKAVRDDGFSELKRDGWMKEAIEEVEKIMDAKGILDPRDAAAIYLRDHPPADIITPGIGTGGAWNFTEPASADDPTDYTKRLLDSRGDDMGGISSQVVNKTLAEIRQAGRQSRR